jgi:hypothetical protein
MFTFISPSLYPEEVAPSTPEQEAKFRSRFRTFGKKLLLLPGMDI